jgi:hypothetical protein
MLFSFSTVDKRESHMFQSLLAALGPVPLFILLCSTAGLAQSSKPLTCQLTKPSVQPQGTNVRFQITLDCAKRVATPNSFFSGSDVLIGLTLYNPSAGESKSSSRATWKSIVDEFTPKYDLPVQRIKMPKSAGSSVVMLSAKASDVKGMTHLLFAAWPLSARKECSRTNMLARSGCHQYGYVLESPKGSGGIHPLASYPGLVIDESGESRSGSSSRQPRWIVERFRN